MAVLNKKGAWDATMWLIFSLLLLLVLLLVLAFMSGKAQTLWAAITGIVRPG